LFRCYCFPSQIKMTNLILDPQIRDWVLIHIVVVMFLVAILRHHTTKLMRGDRKPDLKNIRETQILLRAKRLKTNANKIPIASFHMRKMFFNDKETGLFKERPAVQQDALSMAANPMMDPNNMMEMMKNNMAMVVPQMLLMTWVSHFFSGFVLVKLPFPLTLSFKTMLQRGIDLTTLDVSYVSSLSWYFLVLFGIRGLTTIALGENNLSDDAQLMQQQMGGMGGAPQMDTNKVFQSERENLELVKHEWELENVEKRLLAKSRTSQANQGGFSSKPRGRSNQLPPSNSASSKTHPRQKKN